MERKKQIFCQKTSFKWRSRKKSQVTGLSRLSYTYVFPSFSFYLPSWCFLPFTLCEPPPRGWGSNVTSLLIVWRKRKVRLNQSDEIRQRKRSKFKNVQSNRFIVVVFVFGILLVFFACLVGFSIDFFHWDLMFTPEPREDPMSIARWMHFIPSWERWIFYFLCSSIYEEDLFTWKQTQRATSIKRRSGNAEEPHGILPT